MLEPIAVDVMQGRVGSTLVMQLLGSSREVAFDRVFPYEQRRLTSLVHLAERMAHFVEVERRADSSAAATRALAAFWSAFSDAVLSRHPSARYYAEKIQFPPAALERAGITCRRLMLVRDPRDVLTSIRAFNARTGRRGFGRSLVADDLSYVEWFADHVDARLSDFVGAAAVAQQLLVRYEDLVSDFDRTARRVGAWLDVELRPRYIDAAANRDHITSESVSLSIGRWRNELDEQSGRYLWDRLSGVLEPLGYAP